ASENNYVNGVDELSVSGDYSIDYVNGIIYTFDESPDDQDIVIDIAHQPRIYVTDISFSNGYVQIPDKDYVSEKISSTLNVTNTNVIRTNVDCIEPRSIRFLSQASIFKKEVPFKGDGTEFDINLSSAQLNGYYTVDYKKGIIYTYSQVNGSISLELNKTEYYAEYNIAVEAPKDDYQVDLDKSTITFGDRYIVKAFANSLSTAVTRTLFRVEYSYAEEIQQNPKELEPFFTPIINSYRLAVITRD